MSKKSEKQANAQSDAIEMDNFSQGVTYSGPYDLEMGMSDMTYSFGDVGQLDLFSEEDLEKSTNTILNFISETLYKGNRVEIRNFGTFSTRKREKRISRNPKTGTSVLVEEKSHPYFRASKHLKESLNK